MNKITWLDLYNFLYKQANNINSINKFDWQSPVTIHNAETGDEFTCDTYYISSGDFEKCVLAINIESIFK